MTDLSPGPSPARGGETHPTVVRQGTPSPCRGGGWGERSALLAAAAITIEAVLVAGIVLAMRLDRHPPSLRFNLAGALGLDRRGCALYLALTMALLVVYIVAMLAARGGSRRVAVAAVAATTVFGMTLVAAHPVYSFDVLHYIAVTRVAFAHGENPHITPPAAITGDPLMALSDWKSLPSPYGPAWTWLSRLPFVASGGANDATAAVVWFKLLAVAGLTGATAGVALTAERLRPGAGAGAAVLFGWNPVVQIHLAADGHNDAVMLCLLAWGVVAVISRRPALGLALVGAAALVKPVAALAALALGVWLLRRRAWRAVATGISITLALAVLLIAPYWAGPAIFRAMLDEGQYFTGTLASLAVRALMPAIGGDPARLLIGGTVRVALLLALGVMLSRDGRSQTRLIRVLTWSHALPVTVLCAWYQPWYATWPLLFAAMLPRDRTLRALAAGLTAGALLVPVATNFVAAISDRGGGDLMVEALAAALALAPVGAALAVAAARPRRGRGGGTAIRSAA